MLSQGPDFVHAVGECRLSKGRCRISSYIHETQILNYRDGLSPCGNIGVIKLKEFILIEYYEIRCLFLMHTHIFSFERGIRVT